mmetsp:Transcript_34068/g.89572  ORF Transcript_34068/g.89572 Transcript_34068/m.89572 type:complete len:200 (-) Transcript_34068:161-760(-)
MCILCDTIEARRQTVEERPASLHAHNLHFEAEVVVWVLALQLSFNLPTRSEPFRKWARALVNRESVCGLHGEHKPPFATHAHATNTLVDPRHRLPRSDDKVEVVRLVKVVSYSYGTRLGAEHLHAPIHVVAVGPAQHPLQRHLGTFVHLCALPDGNIRKLSSNTTRNLAKVLHWNVDHRLWDFSIGGREGPCHDSKYCS